jgi:hypothetical protein
MVNFGIGTLATDADAAAPKASRTAPHDDGAARTDAACAINAAGAYKGVGVRCEISKQEQCG